jgi:hypothetical protein
MKKAEGRVRATLLVGVAVVLAGCAAPRPIGLAEADQAAIRAVADSVEALFAAHRFEEGVALNFAADAMTLQPNGPAVRGREAIVGVLKSFPPFSEFKTEIQLLDGEGRRRLCPRDLRDGDDDAG